MSLNRKKPVPVLIALLLVFVLFKLTSIEPRFSDGNIYLYLGRLLGEGKILYKDVFYTSPPLLPYISFLWGSITGFSWKLFTLLPIVLTTVETVFVYLITKKYASERISLLSVSFYLSSFMVLATTDFVSDIHFILPLLLAGTYLFTEKRYSLASALFTIATGVKLYAFVWIAPFYLVLLVQKEYRNLVRFTLISVVLLILIHGAGYLMGGDVYSQNVFLLQFGKYEAIDKSSIVSFLITHDIFLILPALTVLFLSFKQLPTFVPMLLVSLLLFYTLFPDLYYLYFKMLIAALVIVLGVGFTHLQIRFNAQLTRMLILLFLLVAVLTSLLTYTSEQKNASVFNTYNEVVEYLENNPPSNNILYGDYEFTSLVANETGLSIFQNRVDNNSKFFVSGVFSYDELETELQKARVDTILTKGYRTTDDVLHGGWESVVSTEFLKLNCSIENNFVNQEGYLSEEILVWRCTYPE